jgi:hypothetical protein
MHDREPLAYACEAWHHHCCVLLSNADCTLDKFKSHLSHLQIAMKDIDIQWLKYWIYYGLCHNGLIIEKTNQHSNFVSSLLKYDLMLMWQRNYLAMLEGFRGEFDNFGIFCMYVAAYLISGCWLTIE